MVLLVEVNRKLFLTHDYTCAISVNSPLVNYLSHFCELVNYQILAISANYQILAVQRDCCTLNNHRISHYGNDGRN